MKALLPNLLLLPLLMLLAGACRSADGDASTASAAPSGEGGFSYSPQHHEARRLYNTLQGVLADAELEVVLRGDKLEVQGNPRDQHRARALMRAFDSPSLTSDHRTGTWTFKHRDARLFLNSARGHEAWDSAWVAVSLSPKSLHASVPGGSVEAFSRIIAEYDKPR